MSVSNFVKFATTLPPEKVDGQPKAPKQDSFLVDAIRQHKIPITINDYEVGVQDEALPKKAVDDSLGKYSDDQPRDEKGRFGSNGGSNAEHAKLPSEHQAAANYHDARAKAHDEKGNQIAANLHRQAANVHREAAANSGGVAASAARLSSEVANHMDSKK